MICRRHPLRLLVVFAHPDDESFGPAGLLAKYARQGALVFGVFGTRGEFGQTTMFPRPSPATLGRVRERDLVAASRIIGFRAISILPHVDGTLYRLPQAVLTGEVFDAMVQTRPDIVITFGPGGITHHPDHLAIHRAATVAFAQALRVGLGASELYYVAVPPDQASDLNLDGEPDADPNTFIDVSEEFPIKLRALGQHARHILDAREAITRLERDPQTIATLHRAWPPVQPGQRITKLGNSLTGNRRPACTHGRLRENIKESYRVNTLPRT
jgi:LmbE family N-acetylglucosaminyl deacetylase